MAHSFNKSNEIFYILHIILLNMAKEHSHHHHHHHHDFDKNNAEYFSEKAASYRTELSLELAKRTAKTISNAYSFDVNQTEVLDFACGPGLIAFELLPFAKKIVGADISAGMVDVFNKTVSKIKTKISDKKRRMV